MRISSWISAYCVLSVRQGARMKMATSLDPHSGPESKKGTQCIRAAIKLHTSTITYPLTYLGNERTTSCQKNNNMWIQIYESNTQKIALKYIFHKN